MEQLATCVLVENIFPFLDRATYDICRFLNKEIFQLSEQVSNPVWPCYGSLYLHHEIASLAVGDNILAVGCETGEVILVVRKTMKRFLMPPGHTMAVISIQFSPTETLLATGSVDGSIRLWHLRDNDEGGQAFWETPSPPCCISELPSTSEHISCSSCCSKPSGSNLLLTQCDCPSILLENHHHKPVHSLVFDPTSQYLISAADEPTMIIWNTQTGACEHQLRDRWEYPRSLSLSPHTPSSTINNDEHCLAMYGSSGSLRLFSFSTSSFNNCGGRGEGDLGRTLDGGFPQLSEIQFSDDGQFLYGRSGHQQIYLWNIATGQRSCLLPLVKEEQTVVALTMSRECGTVARVTSDGRLVMSKVTHSNDQKVPVSTPMNTPSAYPGQYLMKFTLDGRTLVTANSRPGILEFWGV